MSEPSFMGGLSNPFAHITRVSQILAAVLALFTVMPMLIGYTRTDALFSLNPGYTIPPYFRVWNIVTSGLYEPNVISSVLNVVLLVLFARYLEPIWGPAEFVRFVGIVNVAAGMCSFLALIVMYAVSFRESVLYESHLRGFAGVLSAFSVAMKQLVPEQEIRIFFAVSLRAKAIPALIILISVITFLLGIATYNTLAHTIFGTLAGWIYLRFYQNKGDVRGDLNESFAFATFFPELMQPAVTVLSNAVYKLLTLVGLCRSSQAHASAHRGVSSSAGHVLGGGGGSGSATDMERRRSIAVKALEQRMAIEQRQAAMAGSGSGSGSGANASGNSVNKSGAQGDESSAYSTKNEENV